MPPEVSIITPFYNAEAFCLRTIENVRQQTFPDWEMIGVDDGSTDRTVNLLRGAEESRLRVEVMPKNQGPAVARNLAIELARGRFIAFLDGDDLWHPEKLTRQIAFMKRRNYAFSYAYHRKVDASLKPIRDFHPPAHLTRQIALRYNPLHTSSVVFDSHQLGKVFMPAIRKRQDYGLWLRLLAMTDGFLLPEVLSYYVQRSDSVSRNKLSLVRYNWELYRKIEKLSVIASAYYLGCDVLSKVFLIK